VIRGLWVAARACVPSGKNGADGSRPVKALMTVKQTPGMLSSGLQGGAYKEGL
jgi:hypothetical protein